jgi:hypothetical protein
VAADPIVIWGMDKTHVTLLHEGRMKVPECNIVATSV